MMSLWNALEIAKMWRKFDPIYNPSINYKCAAGLTPGHIALWILEMEIEAKRQGLSTDGMSLVGYPCEPELPPVPDPKRPWAISPFLPMTVLGWERAREEAGGGPETERGE